MGSLVCGSECLGYCVGIGICGFGSTTCVWYMHKLFLMLTVCKNRGRRPGTSLPSLFLLPLPPPLLIMSVRLFTIPQASTINRQLADRIDSCVLPRQQGFPGQYPQFTTANLLYSSVLGRRLLRARLVVRGKKKVSLDTTGLYSSY